MAMGSLPVYSSDNRQVGTIELAPDLVGKSSERMSLVHRAVVMQQASQRQGTASTRGRGEVSGSGKKPWKQKHTGRARAGSVRSPIWRHGGTVFGPKPRSYTFQIPRKIYRTALRAALASMVEEGNVVVLESLELPELKTRVLLKVLGDLGVSQRSVLVLDGGFQEIRGVGRNVQGLKILRPEGLNVYDLLKSEKLVITKDALETVQKIWE